MGWIDDRIAETKARETRDMEIARYAATVFDNLWEEIKRVLAEASSKGIPTNTNGSPEDREVWLSMPIPPGRDSSSRREFHLKLDRRDPGISATGAVSIRLSFDLCEDGVVCLKYADNPISISEAAKLILDRFLFPAFHTK